jgi:hypothetical protein
MAVSVAKKGFYNIGHQINHLGGAGAREGRFAGRLILN